MLKVCDRLLDVGPGADRRGVREKPGVLGVRSRYNEIEGQEGVRETAGPAPAIREEGMSKSRKTPARTGSRRPANPTPSERHAAAPDAPRSTGREEGDSPKPAESATGAAE